MLLKVGENVVWVSNSLDPDETPSYSASHLDPSCLHMVVLGGLKVNRVLSLPKAKNNVKDLIKANAKNHNVWGMVCIIDNYEIKNDNAHFACRKAVSYFYRDAFYDHIV